jgi:hypothetical protein
MSKRTTSSTFSASSRRCSLAQRGQGLGPPGVELRIVDGDGGLIRQVEQTTSCSENWRRPWLTQES